MIVAWLVRLWIGSSLDELDAYMARLAIEMENA